MVSHTAKRRREGKALRKEVKRLRKRVEELRESAKSRELIEVLQLAIATLVAGYQAPQEEDEDEDDEEEEEVRLPTEAWAIIAEKINENDVYSFALVSKQLREAQVLAGRKLATRPAYVPHDIEEYGNPYGVFLVSYFTEGWCAYWSKKFMEDHTDPKVVKLVLYVAAYHGYLQVFEKYWSQEPQRKLRKLLDKKTCYSAALTGHLEVLKWLRAKGCPWGKVTSICAAHGGHLEVLQWMRGQDPPCPWTSDVCYFAASNGHLEFLRWARSQGCPWNKEMASTAAKNGHLKTLVWLIKEGCPYDKSEFRRALEWLDE
ncbi:hypothetical protein HKI87_06g45320 [Chloropicon roscoffensis]|uniref:Uncharacterized protein n=1 Tax=Chloropicon roscoffensis TaxID=1461544 RepID=A0AAX4PAG0_9CHLO